MHPVDLKNTKYCKLRLGNTKEKYGAQYMYYSNQTKPFFIVISLFYFRAEQNVDGPNYNLSGKLTEYTNTYKVYQKFIVLMS